MENIDKYEHIIWDWNGTLLNDVELSLGVINRILERRNISKINCDTYRDIFEFPVENYYKKLGFNYDVDTFEKIADEYIQDFDQRFNETKLQAGTKEVLDKIRKKGISQSILSASKTESLFYFVRHFEISEYFIKIIGLDNHYAASKMRNGQEWIKELQIKPEKVLMIGDTTHDYEVAKSMGIECVLVAAGHESMGRLTRTGAKVVRTISEIISN